MKIQPPMNLVGMDGHIFFVMGMAYKGLKQQGMKQPHLKKKEKIHQHVR